MADNDGAYQSIVLIPRNTQRAIELAFYRIGQSHMAELSRQMLAKDKTGRVYIRRDRRGRRRRHTASAPGQSAANRSGTMRKNRSFEVQGGLRMEFGIKNTRYSAFLERGTRHMEARPTVGNTVTAESKNTQNEFERSLESELQP